MAAKTKHVTANHPSAEQIEHTLSRSLEAWTGITSLAEVWQSWDNYSRFDVEIDWPIQEDRLDQLKDWSRRGLLSDDQQCRYKELLAAVDRNRPLLEKLFKQIELAAS